MKSYVRCKACGYVMEEGKLKDTCPACGVPAKDFEPYKPTINEKRLAALEMHIHPISLHLVMGPTIINTVLLILLLLINGSLKSNLWVVIEFNFFILPFFTLVASLTGIYDGKTRFKKITTSNLQKKIILASAYLVLTIIGLAVILTMQDYIATNIILLAIILLCMGLAKILGTLGSSMLESRLPG